jgi:hypothetical protein
MAPSLTPPENELLRIFAADPKKPESGNEKLVPGDSRRAPSERA